MPTAKDQSIAVPVDLAENDPLLVYLEEASAVVEVDHIPLASPGVDALKNAGVKLVVPLIAQGQLIGVLSLGERQSGADYSTDDQRLLSNLSTDAASALRVAQLVQQQEFHARERERIDQELKIARLIQQTLLPKELPALDGWRMAAYYQPAREVGGDFYDLLALKDGRLGIVIGDVTDKGIPAALVMATTRAILRMMGQQCSSPGEVLSNANNALCPDMPRNMFVTCLYAILNPITGHLRYANAGHGAPYRRSKHGVDELMARGMPLGLMPEMQYEEQETTLKPGETVLFYSDGLIEAHNPQGQMLGFDGLQTLLATYDDNGKGQIDFLLNEMARFIGPNWEQEDDITLLSLQRFGTSSFISISHRATQEIRLATLEYRMKNQIPLGEYILSSEPGNERLAMEYVAKAVAQFNLPQDRLENLKTAVAEATTNAMEHGSGYGSGKPVTLRVRASKNSISVQILDYGKGVASPIPTTPNLDAKLAGRETPRGWGLFLIRNLVDDLKLSREGDMNSTELVLYL
ncbi:MAG TPA: SpoIIE family protein phosphatase [Aggregatilineaceae bacterium]|nr:SpoIIE family protein phosphatase [Aggregatilineaceae bacterium]